MDVCITLQFDILDKQKEPLYCPNWNIYVRKCKNRFEQRDKGHLWLFHYMAKVGTWQEHDNVQEHSTWYRYNSRVQLFFYFQFLSWFSSSMSCLL